MGGMINGGEGVIEVIQKFFSVPCTTTKSLDMNKEMVEICEIFQTVGKSQTLLPIMIPLEIHDRLSEHGHNGGNGAKGQE